MIMLHPQTAVRDATCMGRIRRLHNWRPLTNSSDAKSHGTSQLERKGQPKKIRNKCNVNRQRKNQQNSFIPS